MPARDRLPLQPRRNEIPERPENVMYGAVMAAYHIFDELVSEVPPTELLTSVRRAILTARNAVSASAGGGTPSAGESEVGGDLNSLTDEVLCNPPKSWCDLVARAELAAFYAGARRIDEIEQAYDAAKPHERLAAELVTATLNVAASKKDEREEVPNRTARPGYVYLAKSGPHYKIGRSVSPNRRRCELQIQLPDKVQMLHWIPTHDPVAVERYWHDRFKHRRLNGEWFALDLDELSEFCSWRGTAERQAGAKKAKLSIRVRAHHRRPD